MNLYARRISLTASNLLTFYYIHVCTPIFDFQLHFDFQSLNFNTSFKTFFFSHVFQSIENKYKHITFLLYICFPGSSSPRSWSRLRGCCTCCPRSLASVLLSCGLVKATSSLWTRTMRPWSGTRGSSGQCYKPGKTYLQLLLEETGYALFSVLVQPPNLEPLDISFMN